ncbi:hypothetical protein MAR_019956 [Mya arenaria]|uniref:Uncharacterized protein n=1 Tax=Mya arenaria TaxID=6604 RepID=A0ABY7E728_MYAAR|nr:hypothetical protein MAR_019956 [Mya arenaria]
MQVSCPLETKKRNDIWMRDMQCSFMLTVSHELPYSPCKYTSATYVYLNVHTISCCCFTGDLKHEFLTAGSVYSTQWGSDDHGWLGLAKMMACCNTMLTSCENHNRQISNQLANYNRQVQRQIEALNKKVDALRTVVDVSTDAQHVATPPTNPNTDHASSNLEDLIAKFGHMTENELLRLHAEVNNVEHVACLLTRKVFPELFGPINLRYMYNWNSGSQKKKRKLDIARKYVL